MTPSRSSLLWLCSLLLLAVIGCHDPDSYSPTAPRVAEALEVTSSATSIAADGVSQVTITAQIDPGAAANRRIVKFVTSAGTLVGAVDADKHVREVTIDSNGRAAVDLISSRKVETAEVTVTVPNASGVVARVSIAFVSPGSGALELVALPPAIPADGVSRSQIEALLQLTSDGNPRTIVFTVTEGELLGIGMATGTKILRVVADGGGVARAELRSSTTVGAVDVEAKVEDLPAVSRRTQVEFLPIATGALTLSATPSSIPADGFSRARIVAQLQLAATSERRMVVFRTTRGKLFGLGTGNGTPVLTIGTDSTGTASVELESEAQVGSATLEASVQGLDTVSRQIEVPFTQVDPAQVVTISTSVSIGEADGASVIRVVAEVSPDLPADKRTVTFRTSLGTFKDNVFTSVAGGDNRAAVDLVSPSDVGTATLTASVPGFSAETSLTFGPALPDSVILVLGEASLTRGGTETSSVTVQVARLPGRGRVTSNLVVDFSAVKKGGSDDGAPLALTFRNQTLTNSSQQATAEVRLGSVVYEGTATIRAQVAGSEVIGEQDIEIDAP